LWLLALLSANLVKRLHWNFFFCISKTKNKTQNKTKKHLTVKQNKNENNLQIR